MVLLHSRLVTPKCGDLVMESPPKCPEKTFRFRNYRDNLRIDTPQKSNIDTKNDGLEFGTCISFQTWLYMLDMNVRFQGGPDQFVGFGSRIIPMKPIFSSQEIPTVL